MVEYCLIDLETGVRAKFDRELLDGKTRPILYMVEEQLKLSLATQIFSERVIILLFYLDNADVAKYYAFVGARRRRSQATLNLRPEALPDTVRGRR